MYEIVYDNDVVFDWFVFFEFDDVFGVFVDFGVDDVFVIRGGEEGVESFVRFFIWVRDDDVVWVFEFV